MVIIENADHARILEPVTHFSSFYVRKKSVAVAEDGEEQADGSLLFKETDFHNWKKLSNTCAHANEGYQESAKILSGDIWVLSDFVTELKAARDRKLKTHMWDNNTKNLIER